MKTSAKNPIIIRIHFDAVWLISCFPDKGKSIQQQGVMAWHVRYHFVFTKGLIKMHCWRLGRDMNIARLKSRIVTEEDYKERVDIVFDIDNTPTDLCAPGIAGSLWSCYNAFCLCCQFYYRHVLVRVNITLVRHKMVPLINLSKFNGGIEPVPRFDLCNIHNIYIWVADLENDIEFFCPSIFNVITARATQLPGVSGTIASSIVRLLLHFIILIFLLFQTKY